MQVEGPPPRRRLGGSSRVEQTITGASILAALGWWPYMIAWWMQNGWPAYPETYFVGLVVIPAAILGAGRGLVLGLNALRAWRRGRG
ncbi:MAG: hypothetical protein FJ148_09855 [Deltaproteobacteria bacterium]|nr:hypothetical protein [Deltaproteobacteria bacterium]